MDYYSVYHPSLWTLGYFFQIFLFVLYTYICDLKYDSVAILWMTQSNPWHAYDFKDKVNFMDYHSSLWTLGYFQIFLFVLYINIGFKADYRDLWILFFKGWNLVLSPPFLHSLIWFYHCPVYNYYYLCILFRKVC